LRLFINYCLGLILLCLSVSSFAGPREFCALPSQELSEKAQDDKFIEAMFDAEYVFRGRLFTYYHERCSNGVCAYNGLVFKALEQIENWLSLYVEVSWSEDCDNIWLHQMDWRRDKDKMFFEINKEYLLLAKDTPRGIVIIGSRGGLKVKELQMRYELERIGRK